jgi:hypothetical protein
LGPDLLEIVGSDNYVVGWCSVFFSVMLSVVMAHFIILFALAPD